MNQFSKYKTWIAICCFNLEFVRIIYQIYIVFNQTQKRPITVYQIDNNLNQVDLKYIIPVLSCQIWAAAQKGLKANCFSEPLVFFGGLCVMDNKDSIKCVYNRNHITTFYHMLLYFTTCGQTFSLSYSFNAHYKDCSWIRQWGPTSWYQVSSEDFNKPWAQGSQNRACSL